MRPLPLSSLGLFNLALFALILIGGGLAYQYGNFQGVSKETLEQEYVHKERLSFADLPAEVQQRYIDKEAVIEQSKEGALLDDVFEDEEGKPIPEANVTPKDMKRFIHKLQKTILFLQHDNLLIANEKNEMVKKLEEQTKEREEEKNQLMAQNIEKINEAEQQHYKNISDLTMKINELQKEGVVAAQKSNMEINALKSTIETLHAKAIQEEANTLEAIKRARAEEQDKLVDYKEKIKLLNDQIALLNAQMLTNSQSHTATVERKNEEITKLKEEIALGLKEKSALMASHTQSMVTLEQKHKAEIEGYAKNIEVQKKENEALILKQRQEIAALEEKHQKLLLAKEEELKARTSELMGAKQQIDALVLENEKDFNKFRSYLEDEKRLKNELSVTLKKAEADALRLEKELRATLQQQNEALVKKEASVQELHAKITALKQERIDMEAEIKRRVDENDKIHNKNYKLFNEKIAGFESAKQQMVKSLEKQMEAYKITADENLKKLQFHNAELNRAYNDLKQNVEAKERELLALKSATERQKLEQESVLQSQSTTLASKEEKITALQKELKQKESEALAKVQNLEAALRAKEIAHAATKREEGLKISALEKELAQKANDLNALEKALVQREEKIKTLIVSHQKGEENLSKQLNKEAQAIQKRLTLLEEEYKKAEAQWQQSKSEWKAKELSYLDQLKAAQRESKTTKASVAPASTGKLALQDSIRCTDMPIGVNAPSHACSTRVENFLKRFDGSYFYEITPIVDNGGFASLKLIKSKKVGVEDGEIDRISGLANIGLGKARAKAGGDLVGSIIGEGAKISYALSNLEIEKARGFEIKVYR